MKSSWNFFTVCLFLLLLLNFSFQRELMASFGQGHVVSAGELRHRVAVKATQRADNIREVQTLLRQDVVQRHFGRMVDLEKVELALASLDDESLSQIAQESREVNDQIKAGMPGWAIVLITVGVVLGVLFIIAALTCCD